MTKFIISKDGRALFETEAATKAIALFNYREELGAEAHDYDSADESWTDELEIKAAA